jgi:diketogulonate reductase-like aldo/keto reductase
MRMLATSLLDSATRCAQPELLAKCAALNIHVVAYSPLGQGALLAGAHTRSLFSST